MNKITIKHYLNKKLKQKKIQGVEVYPVYVQVTAKRKTTQIRSALYNYCYQEEFEDIKNDTGFNDEKKTIETMIKTQMKIFDNFDISLFTIFYRLMPDYELEKEYLKYIENVKVSEYGNRSIKEIKYFSYWDIYDINVQKALNKSFYVGGDCYKISVLKNIENLNAAYMILFFEKLKMLAETDKKLKIIQTNYNQNYGKIEDFFI